MFIHGGFLMSFDGSPLQPRGARPGRARRPGRGTDIRSCPDVTLGAIIDEMRAATALLWRRLRLPVVVTGHSAGGHLAACLWPRIGRVSTLRFRPGWCPPPTQLSGVFDLAPLLGIGVNDVLRLSPEEAAGWSPINWTPPTGAIIDAVVGADETREHRRQCRAMAEAWTSRGAAARHEEIAGRNHFDVIAPLADPGSAMDSPRSRTRTGGGGAGRDRVSPRIDLAGNVETERAQPVERQHEPACD